MRENVFQIDRIVRKGMDCLIEGVKRPDSIYRTCRLTISGNGVTYQLEGSFSPRQALELYACLPRPHDGLMDVEAHVTLREVPLDPDQEAAAGRSWIPEWNLTVTKCHPSASVIEGETYAAFSFGMLPPVFEPRRPQVDAEDDMRAPAR